MLPVQTLVCVPKKEQAKACTLNGSLHCFDQRFHVVEITHEGFAALGGYRIFGARHAAFEGFFLREVACIFEFAGVDADVAVRGREQIL